MVFRTIFTWARAHKVITTVLLLILAFGILVLVDGGGLRAPASDTKKAASTATTTTTSTTDVSKSGVLICLAQPQKGKAPAQCVLTLKADDGKYYTLVDADTKKPKINTADLNQRIQVSGSLASAKSGVSSATAGTITVQSYGEIQ